METNIDKYFSLARGSEISITISDIEKKITGLTTVAGNSLIKTLFTKYPIIMSSIAGLIVVSTITLITVFNQTGNTPRNQLAIPVQEDSTRYENQPLAYQQVKSETKYVPYEEIKKLKKRMETAGMTASEIVSQMEAMGIEEKPVKPDDTIVTKKSDSKRKSLNTCSRNKKDTASVGGLDYISKFRYNHGTWAMVKRDGYSGMIDQQMKVVVPIIYDEIEKNFSYNDATWCRVASNGYYGFIDMSGKLVVDTKYDQVKNFKECFGEWAKVYRDGYYGYIDRSGKVVVPLIYDKLNDFSENSKSWLRVSRDGYYGFIDMSGKEIVPAIYDEVRDFKENDGSWARVSRDGHYGFIDPNGNVVVPVIYDAVNDFKENYRTWAKVYRDGSYFFLDRSGKELKVTE